MSLAPQLASNRIALRRAEPEPPLLHGVKILRRPSRGHQSVMCVAWAEQKMSQLMGQRVNQGRNPSCSGGGSEGKRLANRARPADNNLTVDGRAHSPHPRELFLAHWAAAQRFKCGIGLQLVRRPGHADVHARLS